jgi:hypothetical protein
MWPYCGKNSAIWKCPADSSQVVVNGEAKPRVRSMSMNVYLGGWGGTYGNWELYEGAIWSDFKIYMKQSDLANPGPSKIFVFLDMREDSIDMGNFATRMAGYWPATQPGLYGFDDLPGSYHHFAGGFSFAEAGDWRKRDGLLYRAEQSRRGVAARSHDPAQVKLLKEAAKFCQRTRRRKPLSVHRQWPGA